MSDWGLNKVRVNLGDPATVCELALNRLCISARENSPILQAGDIIPKKKSTRSETIVSGARRCLKPGRPRALPLHRHFTHRIIKQPTSHKHNEESFQKEEGEGRSPDRHA